jgi:hypothetical protein
VIAITEKNHVFCQNCSAELHNSIRICPTCGSREFGQSPPASIDRNSGQSSAAPSILNGVPGNLGNFRIPIWSEVGSAYAQVFANLGVFARLAWLPIAISYSINFAVGFYTGANAVPFPEFVGVLNQLFFASVFAVSWHRFVMLGDTKSNQLASLSISGREFLFTLATVLILIAVYGVAFVIGVLGAVLAGGDENLGIATGILGLLAAGVISSRLIFVFPSIAVDLGPSISESFSETSKNTWRIWFSSALLIGPASLVSGLANQVVADLVLQSDRAIPLGIAIEITSFVVVFAGVAFVAGFASQVFLKFSPRGKNI